MLGYEGSASRNLQSDLVLPCLAPLGDNRPSQVSFIHRGNLAGAAKPPTTSLEQTKTREKQKHLREVTIT